MQGVILAGGLSTRMGSDKAQLRVGGRRVLERNRELLATVCGKSLIVARDAQQAASLELPGATIVTDLIPQCGPLGGIHTAFAHIDDDLFVLACDLLFIEAPMLSRLADQFQRDQPRVLLPRTSDGDGWREQPLCAIWSRNCKDAIAAAVSARHFSLVRLLQTWPDVLRVDIPAEESDQLRNINTPADLPDDPAGV